MKRNLGNLSKADVVADPQATTQRKARSTDGTAHFTPSQLAGRWAWHPESVRRKIRNGGISAIVLGRRLLIPIVEIQRLESEGRIGRAV